MIYKDIYYFNPGHEAAVHNASPYYMPPSNVKRMQEELSFLPAWYAPKNASVLVNDSFDFDFVDQYHNIFTQLPYAIKECQLKSHIEQKANVWGISPQVIHFIQQINKVYDLNIVPPKWSEEYISFNSRKTARDCLKSLTNSIPELKDLAIPQFCSSLSDVEYMVQMSEYRLLAKAPYSSSGRGLLWLPEDRLPQSERQILHGIIKKQGCVSIEKVLNKQIDFAMEFLSDGKGNISFEGYSLFQTNAKGAYQGNVLASQEYIHKILTNKLDSDLLERVKIELEQLLGENFSCIYEGCIGVDMFIYLENNEYKIHPCVEINMRYNMGFLSIRFCDNYLDSESIGIFRVDFNKEKGEVYSEHMKLLEERPAIFKNQKISSGYSPLCPVNQDSHYWAYVLID